MNNFYDWRFSKLFGTELGKELWEMLNRPEVVERLKEVSRYRRAAVDAVTEEIENSFGKRLEKTGKVNQYKQMIGAMIKSILLNEGFEHVRSNARSTRGSFFYCGSIYREREEE